MALGDGIRRNIASVDPEERRLLRDAFVEMNRRFFPGSRDDRVPGHVSWWFKQDEIHQGTHVHNGPEFLPWHRVIVNELEKMLREINPQLSLHYWDWTRDPRRIPNANLGDGRTGTLNLFTEAFMGYGGSTRAPIGEPWLTAAYYVTGARLHRDDTNNPADPPRLVQRHVSGSPASAEQDAAVLRADDYADMRRRLESVHNAMHGFVAMGGQHISFRDPFVFLLHSNVDRLVARWQTDPRHRERLNPATVFGTESNGDLNRNVEPWSGGLAIRPWAAPENLGRPFTYKHPSVVYPPSYDTNIGTEPNLRGLCTIQHKHNHRFLDAYESSDRDFSVVTRLAQTDGSQRWRFTVVAGVYTIQHIGTGRFLHAGSETGHSFVSMEPAQNSDDLRWVMVPVPGRLDVVRFQHMSTGQFLDANQGGLFGYSVVTMPTQNGDSQYWDLSVPAPNTYKLQQKSSGRFLDATEEQFGVSTQPASPNTSQRWALRSAGTVYTIQHERNGRFLDAHEDTANDFRLVTCTSQNNDSQRWLVRPLSSDTFTVQQLRGGRFVDAYTSSTNDFSAVTRTAQNNDTQRWVIRSLPAN